MRLTSALVQRTLSQFEAQAIPEDHPSMPDLSRTLGDHTFFIAGDGLHIVEPTVPEDGHETGQVFKVASWQDANRTSLVAHPPEPTDVMVDLELSQTLLVPAIGLPARHTARNPG